MAALTVRVAVPVADSNAAEMVVLPTFLPVAKPLTVIEAIEEYCDCHVATFVMSCVVPSENVATATNCWLSPKATLVIAGVTEIEVAVAEVTDSVALPEMDPEVAVMVVLPFATALANPFVGKVLLTVATAVLPELHDADDVMS